MTRFHRILISAVLLVPSVAYATIFGSVRGVVHDPQHRPIQGANVTLKAQNSDWTQYQDSSGDGEFEFSSVPLGNYTVNVLSKGFQQMQQGVIVQSDTSPVLHFELTVAGVKESIIVPETPVEATTESVTPTTMVNRIDIQQTPGADRTNGMEMITDYVPAAYVTHDMLHMRGGHQVDWLIDGVPIPNTNIANNIGPQIDPKDIDYLEVQRGSYDADYGDRTYGVFNVVPRTGFERYRECDLVITAGNFYQTNDQISCGGHTQRFAYYASLNGNRSNLGLQPPTPQVLHDADNGFGGFTTLIFNVDPKDQLRLVVSSRRDYYQIPISTGVINQIDDNPGAIFLTPCVASASASVPCPPGIAQYDGEHEADTFVNFTWVRTISADSVLTVSPLYHYNSANYTGNPNDFPTDTTDDRTSNYVGGQVTFTGTVARNSISVGYYGFWQRDNQLFSVVFNDGSATNFADREIANGSLQEIWVEDKLKVTPWLTLSGGVRQSHFSSTVTENATSPRAGISLEIPRVKWVFHGFYGHFYQAPPLLTFLGLPLVDAAQSQG